MAALIVGAGDAVAGIKGEGGGRQGEGCLLAGDPAVLQPRLGDAQGVLLPQDHRQGRASHPVRLHGLTLNADGGLAITHVCFDVGELAGCGQIRLLGAGEAQGRGGASGFNGQGVGACGQHGLAAAVDEADHALAFHRVKEIGPHEGAKGGAGAHGAVDDVAVDETG